MARGFYRAAKWIRGESTGQTAYSGAQVNRLSMDWIWSHLSADKEIHGDLITLRTRARELVRNTSWGKNYIRLLRNNVVGANGITLQGRLRKADGTPARDLNTGLEASWNDWGQRATCTVDGKLSWRGVQRLAIASLAMDGEFLLRFVPGFKNAYGFAVQVLDPDYLDHTYCRARTQDQNEIRYGVEVDEWNRPIAYHLWEGHPSEITRGERRPIPADQILHLYDSYRVAQTRGVTWLAPVMLNLHMLEGYFEAELVASRQGAAKGGFFVKKGESLDAGEGDGTEPLKMEVEPGTYDKLPAGWEFQANDPQHPTTAFSEFVKAALRAIATGLGVSYSALTNDLTDVNYSSIRAGILNEHDEYRDLQALVVEGLCDPVYRQWLRMARLTGVLDVRIPNARYATEIEWAPRGWTWVDPQKEGNAAIAAVSNGFNSRKRLLAAQGLDYEEVLAELADEQKLAASYGLEFTGPAQPAGAGMNDRRAAKAITRLGLSVQALAEKPMPDIHVNPTPVHVEAPAVHVDVAAPPAPNVEVAVHVPTPDRQAVVEDGSGKVLRRIRLVTPSLNGNGKNPSLHKEVVGGR